MKNIIFLKILIIISIFVLAHSARADYIVNLNNTQTSVENYFFNFPPINYDNWQSLRNYKNLRYIEKSTNNSFATFNKNTSTSTDMAAYLRISAPVLSAYKTANIKYKNASNTGNAKNYTMFQVPNHPYLGFIITGVASTANSQNLQNILADKNNQILVGSSLQNVTIKKTNANDLIIKTLNTKKLMANLYISLVVIPDASMPSGITNVNEKIGTLIFYETSSNSPNIQKKQINLNIKTALNISLPSCNVSVKKLNINLGKVSLELIKQGMPYQTATFILNCSTDISTQTSKKQINNIYAKAYDANFPLNKSLDGDLKIKCVGKTEAKGVKVRIKLNNKKTRLGDNILFNPKFILETGALIADLNFIKLGENVGANLIKVSATYVKDKNASQITAGCANADMGIIFNYD